MLCLHYIGDFIQLPGYKHYLYDFQIYIFPNFRTACLTTYSAFPFAGLNSVSNIVALKLNSSVFSPPPPTHPPTSLELSPPAGSPNSINGKFMITFT